MIKSVQRIKLKKKSEGGLTPLQIQTSKIP